MDALEAITHLISVVGGTFAILLYASRHKKLAVQMTGWFLILSGVICVAGYIVDATTHFTVPPNTTPMAFATGVCFIVAGAAILILSESVNGSLN